MPRPRNWYDMDDDARRAWQRQESEREDLEYERDRQRENAESSQRYAEEQRRARRREAESHEEEMSNLRDELNSIMDKLRHVQTFNKELLAACKAALDPDPCHYDHHGNCQAHGGGNPCAQALLRAAIAKAEGR